MFVIRYLNIFGANKVILNFGKYLTENYKLTDHRKGVVYKDWNTDYIHNKQLLTLLRQKKNLIKI